MAASTLARPVAASHGRKMVAQPSFLSGKLLLAMPGMADPRFERAVIALCVHDENGAVGIGIGHKRAGISFRGLLRQLDEEMTRHGWFTASTDAKILFDTPADERWAAAFKAEGIDPRLLASETGAA